MEKQCGGRGLSIQVGFVLWHKHSTSRGFLRDPAQYRRGMEEAVELVDSGERADAVVESTSYSERRLDACSREIVGTSACRPKLRRRLSPARLAVALSHRGGVVRI